MRYLPHTGQEIAQMLQGYVTKWGSDPVWRSRLPDLVPTTGDFPRAVASRGGLTLEELPPAARVAVAGHEVQFDPDRLAWYADIEIEMGESYFPFVRLALARFQPHSLDGAHLSRVVMSDFMQVAPDRTAELARGRGAFGITVRGYAGQNIVGKRQADLSILPPSKIKVVPNTTMRAAVERRPPGVPGDLGWERVGAEVTLKAASTSSFHVTWTGSLTVPKAPAGHAQRIVVTEIETFPRDPMPGDSILRTSPADRVRERIVYADTFEL